MNTSINESSLNTNVITCAGEEFREVKYSNVTVVIDSNGYYQASKFCKDTGKRISDWLGLARTNELLKLYGHKLHLSVKIGRPENSPSALLIYRDDKYRQYQGYYIHEDLVHQLTEWCDLEYAYEVGQIMKLLRREVELRVTSDLNDRLNRISSIIEQLDLNNIENDIDE